MKTPWYSVAKSSGFKNVSPIDRRSDDNLSRGMYRPLDKRELRDESVFPRLLIRQRGSNLVDDEMNDLPASDYERGYMT